MNAHDKATWEDVIQTHDRQVFVSLLALGIGPEKAREVAQMTWTRLIEQHSKGAIDDMNFPGLALKQARFFALSDLRKRSSEHRLLAAVPDQDSSPTQPDQSLASKEQLELALTTLEHCSPNAKKLFRLIYTPPYLSHKESAEKLGLSLQRTRQILCETRKTLRIALEDHHDLLK